MGCAIAIPFLSLGCVTPTIYQPSNTRILQPDQSDDMGGTFMESGDIRTVASRMTGSLLSTPEIANHTGLARIALAPVRNSTRFIVDKDIFMKRLRIEMNKVASGRVRFFSQGMGQAVRRDILGGQDERAWDSAIDEVAIFIAGSPLVQKASRPLRVAVIPVRNTNIAGLDADSLTAIIRSKIAGLASGKVTFLAREANGKAISQILKEADLRNLGLVESDRNHAIMGVDYFLGGEFIARSLMATSAATVNEGSLSVSKDDPRVLTASAKTSQARPNVTTYLNVMLIDAQTGAIPVEKLVRATRKMDSGLGSADYLLTGEMSALSKASASGDRSDYIILSFQLVDPQSNEVVWEDMYETKKVSSTGVIYK